MRGCACADTGGKMGLFEIQHTAGWKESQSCSNSLLNIWRQLRGREERGRGRRAGNQGTISARRAGGLHDLTCGISEQGLAL